MICVQLSNYIMSSAEGVVEPPVTGWYIQEAHFSPDAGVCVMIVTKQDFGPESGGFSPWQVEKIQQSCFKMLEASGFTVISVPPASPPINPEEN